MHGGDPLYVRKPFVDGRKRAKILGSDVGRMETAPLFLLL